MLVPQGGKYPGPLCPFPQESSRVGFRHAYKTSLIVMFLSSHTPLGLWMLPFLRHHRVQRQGGACQKFFVLLHLRARAADDVAPLRVLRADELGELLGSHKASLDAEVRRAARDVGVRE